MFIGSTLQLLDNSTPPLSLSINDIQSSRTVKEVLDNLCLIKQINNTTYDLYEYAEKEESLDYRDLEPPETLNTRYYACVVDKNRAGAKPRLLYDLAIPISSASNNCSRICSAFSLNANALPSSPIEA